MTDSELIERVLNGETSHFQELVARYKGFVFRTAYAVTGRTADADDVLQEAFFSAYQGLGKLQDRGNLRGWLHGITYHTAQDWLRKHIQKRTVERPLQDAENRPAPDDPNRGDDEMKQRIMAGLDGLTEALRQVVLLRYVEGMSYREISQTLGVTESVVGERLFRARQHFEKHLVAR